MESAKLSPKDIELNLTALLHLLAEERDRFGKRETELLAEIQRIERMK